MNIDFVFTDQHAYLATAQYFTTLDRLDRIDWPILQSRDFRRSDNQNLGKTDRYQAEALVWKHLPVEGILGVCCFNESVRDGLRLQASALGRTVRILKASDWFFE
jgi:hypothetical protein